MKKITRRPKYSLEFMREYFKNAGCELLSQKYTNNKQELKYRCKCGQIRYTTYNNFYRSKFRCETCFCKKCELNSKKKLKVLQLREKYYTFVEAAFYLGIEYSSFYAAVRQHWLLPAPTRKMGNHVRCYYSKQDLDEMKKLLI